MRQIGFTLVELITIIIILGIIGAVAAPRFFNRADFDDRNFYDQVIATLRFAQKTAIAKRRFVCVTFPANNQISLAYGGTNACLGGALTRPSGEPYPLTSNNATFAPVPPGFTFDALGRPSGPQTITVNGYGTNITVEVETGYVH